MYRCPYTVGNVIRLRLVTSNNNNNNNNEKNKKNGNGKNIITAANAKIIKVFEPFTLSCAMVVQLDAPHPRDYLVLKLFDRRFATEARQDVEIKPWSLDIESQYHQFVLGGGASEFIKELKNNEAASEPSDANEYEDEDSEQEDEDEAEDDDDEEEDENDDDYVVSEGEEENEEKEEEEEEEKLDDPHNEAHIHKYMHDLYETEVEVYNRLKDIQGKDVPQLHAHVMVSTLPSSSQSATTSSSSPSPSLDEYVDIPGILLQYIDGFPLSDIATRAPKQSWQTIGEEAMRIVNLIGDRGIMNRDVKLRNFIIQTEQKLGEEGGEPSFKIFMIDFSVVEFHEDYALERDWWDMKAHEDEEGAVGYLMHKRLGDGFTYRRSDKYEKLDDEFMRAE